MGVITWSGLHTYSLLLLRYCAQCNGRLGFLDTRHRGCFWSFWVPIVRFEGMEARLGPKSPPFRHWDVGFSSFWTPAGPKVKIRCPELGVTESSQLRCEVRSDSVRKWNRRLDFSENRPIDRRARVTLTSFRKTCLMNPTVSNTNKWEIGSLHSI